MVKFSISKKSGTPTRCSYCSGNITQKEWECSYCGSAMHSECLQLHDNKCGNCSRSSRPACVVSKSRRETREAPASHRGDWPVRTSKPGIFTRAWGAITGWFSHPNTTSRSFQYGGWGRPRNKDWGKKALVILSIVVTIVSVGLYKKAYSDSAEWITITVADKTVHRSTDDDGHTTYSYTIYTHAGEEFNCKSLSFWKGGETTFNQLRVNQQYDVLVAGLGILDRDILEVKRKR